MSDARVMFRHRTMTWLDDGTGIHDWSWDNNTFRWLAIDGKLYVYDEDTELYWAARDTSEVNKLYEQYVSRLVEE